MWSHYSEMHIIHTVEGELLVYEGLYSPQLKNTRALLVWLPPTYATHPNRRYKVIYMHDGNNLFDEHVSFSGEWDVDETMTMLSAEGREAIVVGIPNMGSSRFIEYNPYPVSPQHNPYPSTIEGAPDGQGNAYLDFISHTIKPLIDSTFRTLPDAPHTGIAGSSMGGLISLYGFITRPDVFGFCGAFSTAFWFGNGGLVQDILSQGRGFGKAYLDVGTKEGYVFDSLPIERRMPMTNADAFYTDGVRALRDAMLARGYQAEVNLRYVEDKGGIHREDVWAKRLPDALRFLLA